MSAEGYTPEDPGADCVARTEGHVVVYATRADAPAYDPSGDGCLATCWEQLDGTTACMEPVTTTTTTHPEPDALALTGPPVITPDLAFGGAILLVVGVALARGRRA